MQLGSTWRQIGIVPQDSLLFDGSVRDNIALTAPEATSEQIEAAARVVCAHDFIMELPQGYASKVGERVVVFLVVNVSAWQLLELYCRGLIC